MAMAQSAEKWFNGLGNDRQETIRRLTKQSVQDGHNKRLGADENTPMHSHTIGHSKPSRGYGGTSGQGYEAVTQEYGGQQYRQQVGETYESSYIQPSRSGGYGAREQEIADYGRGQVQTQAVDPGYSTFGSEQQQESRYGARQGEHERHGHGHKHEGREEGYAGQGSGYERNRREQFDEEVSSYGNRGGYGGLEESQRRGERGGYQREEYQRDEYQRGGGNEYETRREYGGREGESSRRGYSEVNYDQSGGYGQNSGYGQSGVSDQFERMNIGQGRGYEGEGASYGGGEERQREHQHHHQRREEEEEGGYQREGHHGGRRHHQEENEYGQY